MSGIASMTGFARVEGASETARWVWEIRSVNGRGLDIRVRAPGFVDQADRSLRQAAAKRFKRGAIQANLTFERSGTATAARLDRAALRALLEELRDVDLPEDAPVAPARLDGLLLVKGVMTTDEPAEAEADKTAPIDDIDPVLDALQAARLEEGARLATVLLGLLDQIAELAARASELAARQPAALAAKYRETIARLVADAAAPLPEERIVQEAAALAVKADVTEELDRLAAHVDQARSLLAEGGPIGRRLDFLAQEFNREANTLGSKSADLALTRVALDLKAAIDALREQAQNVE